jgi:hypothetical protein
MPDQMGCRDAVSIEDRQRIGEHCEEIVIVPVMRGITDVAMIEAEDEQPALDQEAAELVGPKRRVCPCARDQQRTRLSRFTEPLAPETNRPALDGLDHRDVPLGPLTCGRCRSDLERISERPGHPGLTSRPVGE